MSRAARRSVWLLPLLGDRSLGGREVFAAASEKELHNDCRMVYNVPMTGAEQMEGIADRTYYDTGEAIKVGDVIYLDNHRGVVEGVFEPGTEDCKAFSCEETGGILIDMDEFGLMLTPFGDYAYLTSNPQK